MIVEIIKYEPLSRDDNEIIFHRHEAEDFSCNAQLIVAPSQIALFVNEGEIVPFLPGHYTLNDSNNSAYEFIEKLRRHLSNGESAYHCYVYFINLVTYQDLKFGTQSPILLTDPVEHIEINVRAAGLFGAHLDNDNKDAVGIIKFFTKVVGTRAEFTKKDLEEYLRGKIIERVTSLLGLAIDEKKIGILQIAKHYAELSDSLKAQMIPFFKDFGVVIDNFSFVTINAPEEDLKRVKANREALNTALYEAQVKDITSAAEARKRAREGYTYQQEKGFDVLKEAAGNEATPGQFMGAGMGLGMGFGIGGAVGGAFGSVANDAFASTKTNTAPQPAGQFCPTCGSPIVSGAKFCSNCGTKIGKICPNCHANVDEGAKFCPNCGQKVE